MPDQDDHKPRFLVPGAPTGRFEQGYADEAVLGMRAEPECLDLADWKRYIEPRRDQSAAERLAAEQRAREKDAKLLSQEERISKAVAVACSKRRDVSREVWVLRRMQAAKRPPDVVEKRVQRLERIAILGRAA